MRTRLSLCVKLLLTLTLTFAAVPLTHAGFLVNGDFSQGLTGYTVNPDGFVTVANNQATITEDLDPLVQEVDLTQTFTIPVGATTFSFQLIGFTLDTTSSYPLPAGFNASLFDSSGTPVSTAFGSADAFFTQDLTAGASPVPGSGVTLSPADGSTPLTVSLDVSALGGQDATILFRLLAGGDSVVTGIPDTVTIANLNVEAPSPVSVVPGPPGIVLASIGFLSFTLFCLIQGRRFST